MNAAMLLLTVLLGAPPVAPSADAPQERVLTLLSAIHETPSRDAFEKAAPDVQTRLLRLAAQEDLFPAYRARAFDALGAYWPDDTSFAVFRAALASAKTTEDIRHRLLLATPRFFGAKALALVEPWLSHADPQLRLSALEGVAFLPDRAAADTRLKAALADEDHPMVRARLEKLLARPTVR